jgi:hypothetical protein
MSKQWYIKTGARRCRYPERRGWRTARLWSNWHQLTSTDINSKKRKNKGRRRRLVGLPFSGHCRQLTNATHHWPRETKYIKVKVSPFNMSCRHRGRPTALLILNLGAKRRGWQRHTPAALTPGRRPVVQKAGWAQCCQSRRLWKTEHLWPPPGFEPWNVQPVASRYTDYAPPPPMTYVTSSFVFEMER